MLNVTASNDLRAKAWEIFGGKRAFFLKYADVIGAVINDFKLEPINAQLLNPMKMTAEMKKSENAQLMLYLDPGTHGGKRFAHLHYRGDIYMLNHEQWTSFTTRIQNDFVNRLKTAKAISVEQIQDLSDALDPIA